MNKYQMLRPFILTVAGGVIAFRSAERSRRSLVLVAVCSMFVQ